MLVWVCSDVLFQFDDCEARLLHAIYLSSSQIWQRMIDTAITERKDDALPLRLSVPYDGDAIHKSQCAATINHIITWMYDGLDLSTLRIEQVVYIFDLVLTLQIPSLEAQCHHYFYKGLACSPLVPLIESIVIRLVGFGCLGEH
jgi:hypothetical protein